MRRVQIIAEIGCNHNGDKELAKQMVLEASRCGVDGVKFQTFDSTALISRYAEKAEYQKKNTGTTESQLEMTQKLEMPFEVFEQLRGYAQELGMNCFSTPFDMGSIDLLEKSGQCVWKIPSGEITNLPYLERIGKIKCEKKLIILSSGMASVEEIRRCISILKDTESCKTEMILLHCNTEYPSPDEDINLSAISDLHRIFPDIQIGFSDHSVGYVAAVGAVALGAVMIEKHFTLDKSLPGPDHKASATVEELKELVGNVRRMERMFGFGQKVVTESEGKNKSIARKSIVAKCDIRKGEIFTEKNITCKRPGNGISPMMWYEVLGKEAQEDFYEDQLICDSRFEVQK